MKILESDCPQETMELHNPGSHRTHAELHTQGKKTEHIVRLFIQYARKTQRVLAIPENREFQK